MRGSGLLALCMIVLSTGACDDPFGPRTWSAVPDTLEVWSASRVELQGRPAALDLAGEPPFPLEIESAAAIGAWDVVLMDGTEGLALAPASYFPGHASSRAAITVLTNTSFTELRQAPGDSMLYSREPVALSGDVVYVVRTRAALCADGTGTGVHYAKLRAIEIDVAAGRARVETVNNPYCADRSLIPPD